MRLLGWLVPWWAYVIAVALVGSLIGGLYLRGNHWRDAFTTLNDKAGTIVLAVRSASDNPTVTLDTAAGQIVALGDSNRALKQSVASQNEAIDQMAREAVRLKARAAEMKVIADKAQAQRESALKRLSDLSITPGTRGDCMQLLREAEEALDLVREAGL